MLFFPKSKFSKLDNEPIEFGMVSKRLKPKIKFFRFDKLPIEGVKLFNLFAERISGWTTDSPFLNED